MHSNFSFSIMSSSPTFSPGLAPSLIPLFPSRYLQVNILMLLLWLTHRNPGILRAQRIRSLFLGFTCCFWQMWHQKMRCSSEQSFTCSLPRGWASGGLDEVNWLYSDSYYPWYYDCIFYTSGLLIIQAKPRITVLQQLSFSLYKSASWVFCTLLA